MWVVKLGGSLHGDALLPDWLSLLTELGSGRVVIVCGGGRFADEVRRTQMHWHIADLAAHNMAVLAMAQGAHLLHALNSQLELVDREADIATVLRCGQAAVWAPYELLRDADDEQTNWDVTSDSIALGLAKRLDAERLLVVKSCPISPAGSVTGLVECGVLDRAFAYHAQDTTFPIHVIQVGQLPQVRALLIDVHAPSAPESLSLCGR
jgi:aspartokinase-like uncharacterized kinase